MDFAKWMMQTGDLFKPSVVFLWKAIDFGFRAIGCGLNSMG